MLSMLQSCARWHDFRRLVCLFLFLWVRGENRFKNANYQNAMMLFKCSNMFKDDNTAVFIDIWSLLIARML